MVIILAAIMNYAAGQSVFHLHIHVIPRYLGDVEQPKGGIRHVIPKNASYNVKVRETVIAKK